MSLFEKNLSILEKILPDLAPLCRQADTSNYSLVPSRQGADTLAATFNDKTHHFHSSYDPVKEALGWFASLDLSQTQVLFVYGVGLGYYYEAAKPWLEKSADHYLVFLEDDVQALASFLHTERAGDLLKDRQVQLHYFPLLSQAEPMIDWVLWYFIQQPLEVSALEYYRREKKDTFNQLRRTLTHEAVVKNAMVAEYMRHGASFFHNYYGNLLYLHESAQGNAFFGQFKGVPAIICGAGPSLKKNMDHLRRLKDRALLFAGGSSVNALTAAGIIPHFGGGIDPNPPQLDRLLNNQAYEVPFFYRGRMFHEAFKAIGGKKLHITGSGGYPIADWIEEKLRIPGTYVEEGHNVINFLMEIAAHMGCSPIILVGMDLAYTDMEAYAPGVVDHASVDRKTIEESRDMDSGAFIRQDIHGQPVYTLWKWVTEAAWITDFARQKRDLSLINATEGGLGFEGVPNQTLREAGQTLPVQGDLTGRVWTAIAQATMPHVTEEIVLSALEELDTSLKTVIDLCNHALDDSQPLVHVEKKLIAEPAYRAVLCIFNDVYSRVLQRELHQVHHDRSLPGAEEKEQARLQLQKRKFQFLKDCASTNHTVMRKVIDSSAQDGHSIPCFKQAEVL